jgi:hypothetical protein
MITFANRAPWGRVLPSCEVNTQLAKKLSAFYGIEPFKAEARLYNIYEFSPHLKENNTFSLFIDFFLTTD